MTTDSPLYDRVSPKHQWSGPLPGLLTELRRRAWGIGMSVAGQEEEAREGDKDWAWVVLPRGAVVGVRIRSDHSMRNELRIARAEAPKDEKAEAAWEREVAVFLDQFGIAPLDGETPSDGKGWWRQDPHPNDEGKAAVRLLELRAGEVRPLVAFCFRCLNEDGGLITEVPWNHVGIRGQRCERHGPRKKATRKERVG